MGTLGSVAGGEDINGNLEAKEDENIIVGLNGTVVDRTIEDEDEEAGSSGISIESFSPDSRSTPTPDEDHQQGFRDSFVLLKKSMPPKKHEEWLKYIGQ